MSSKHVFSKINCDYKEREGVEGTNAAGVRRPPHRQTHRDTLSRNATTATATRGPLTKLPWKLHRRGGPGKVQNSGSFFQKPAFFSTNTSPLGLHYSDVITMTSKHQSKHLQWNS